MTDGHLEKLRPITKGTSPLHIRPIIPQAAYGWLPRQIDRCLDLGQEAWSWLVAYSLQIMKSCPLTTEMDRLDVITFPQPLWDPNYTLSAQSLFGWLFKRVDSGSPITRIQGVMVSLSAALPSTSDLNLTPSLAYPNAH